MSAHHTTSWINAGLSALPVYGLLTAWSSWTPQPNQETDPQAWAEFVSSPSYLFSHLVGSTGGTILAIFGVMALGIYLSGGRTGRLAIPAMVLTMLGLALLLIPAVVSTFATPAIGQAYLNGVPGVMDVVFPDAMTASFLAGLLFALVGNILLGVAIWRSATLPAWTGILWIVASVVFYLLGVVLGLATTGATLPTQSIGAALIAVSGAGIAWSALRRRAVDARISPRLASSL